MEQNSWIRVCEDNSCVELRWRGKCDSASCVEVSSCTCNGGTIKVRDSKRGAASPVLSFTQAEWDAFTAGVRAGEFDL